MSKTFNKDVLSSFFEEVLDYRGKTPKKLNSNWTDNGYRAISANNVKTNGLKKLDSIRYVDQTTYDKWMKIEIERGDLLLTSEAPAGEVMIWDSDEKIVLSQRLFGLRVNDRIYNKYLKYYLQSDLGQKEILRNTSGSTVFGISAKMFDLINVHYPEKNTQILIGDLLSDLDAKIEVNNKINVEMEAMVKLIYDYWFVQFDFPFDFAQGKPDINGKPYKSSGGKMVYNAELKREIPEGWGANTMSDWIESDANGDWGETKPTGNYTVKVNCIRGADLPSLDGLKENQSPLRYIHENKRHKILESNDLIVEISGGSPTQSTGRISFVTEETFKRYEAPLICANFCKAVRLKEPKNLYIFYHTWKEAFEQGNMFNYEGKTSGIRNLLFSSLVESFKVPIPDAGLVEKFYDFMKPIQKQKQRNLLENQKLAELRDWLLPMLMNGQVTVREAEEQLGMVAEEGENYNTNRN